jgi:hypothetical protein
MNNAAASRKTWLASSGALVSVVAASSCCLPIIPFVDAIALRAAPAPLRFGARPVLSIAGLLAG